MTTIIIAALTLTLAVMVFALGISVEPDHKRDGESLRRSKGVRDRTRPLSHPCSWTTYVRNRAEGLPDLEEPLLDSIHGVILVGDASHTRSLATQDEFILHQVLADHALHWGLPATPFIYASVVGFVRLANPVAMHFARGFCASPRYTVYELEGSIIQKLDDARAETAGSASRLFSETWQEWARIPGMRCPLAMAIKVPRYMCQCLLHGRLRAIAFPLSPNLNSKQRRAYLGLAPGHLLPASKEPLGWGQA